MVGQPLQHVPDIDHQRAFGRIDRQPLAVTGQQFEPGFLGTQQQGDKIDVLVRPGGFRETFEELYAEMDRVGAVILGRIAVWLGLDERWFDAAIDDGNSVLRLLHYPPVPNAESGAIRAGAHEDINLITLLLGAEEAGLELLTREGKWLDVNPPEGALVVNIGDMLQRLTNHVLPSTTHRVRNPQGPRAAHSRYSMPFFLHLRSDFPFVTLPQCVTSENPDRYPDSITADDYLQERLREIGLKA